MHFVEVKAPGAEHWIPYTRPDFAAAEDAQQHIDDVILRSPLYLEISEKPEFRIQQHRASELDFLRWFYQNADFGPADSDVRAGLQEIFVRETGNRLPQGYDEE